YEEKSVYDDQLSKIKEDLKQAISLSSELKNMLLEVKEQLTLQDVIKSQASKQVEVTFDEQINELLLKIGELDVART
ncbi:AAA family ATPase, partial [Escherichia coli]|nr:AAA family ATPase [Escherichia coli]